MSWLKLILFHLAVGLQVVALFSQNVSSLKSAEIDSLNITSFNVRLTHVDSSMAFALQALHLAESLNYRKGIAQAHSRLGMGFLALGKPDSALAHYQIATGTYLAMGQELKAASIAQKRSAVYRFTGDLDKAIQELEYALSVQVREEATSRMARTYNLMGPIYRDLGRNQEAIEVLYKGLELRKQLGNPHRMALSYQNLGNQYLSLDMTDKAIELYEEAVEVFTASDHLPGLADAHLNLAAALYAQEDYENALTQIDSAITLFVELKQEDGLGRAWMNRGAMLSRLDKPEQAIAAYDTAMNYYQASGNELSMVDLLANRSSLSNDQQQFRLALRQAQRGVELARQNDYLSPLRVLLEQQALAYEGLGLLDSAIIAYQASMDVADSLKNDRTTEQLAESEMREKYNAALRIQEIKELKAERELEAERVQRRTLQRNVLVGAFVIMLILAFLLYRDLRYRGRLAIQQQKLHEERISTMLDQHQIGILDALVEGQQKERERIGTDLHDRLGSMLGAIKLQFGALEQKVTEMGSAQEEHTRTITGLIDDASHEVRRISHDMLRGNLAQFGLVQAIQDLCDSIRVPGLEVELLAHGMEQRVERDIEIAAYRIIQELITNAVKHSGASSITVQLTASSALLNLLVEDNGTGFSEEDNSTGVGLSNVRSRVDKLSGSLLLDTHMGRGTSISVDLPISA